MKTNLNSKLIGGLSVGVLVGAIATMGVTSSNAGPTGIVACANNKTLVVELAKKGKCKSGYTKVTFGVPVPITSPSATPGIIASPTPTPSPSSTTIYNYLSVYDAAGSRLGPIVSATPYGTWAFVQSGIVIAVNPETGVIVDNGRSGYFSNSNCTGTVYWPLDPAERASRYIASDPLFVNYTPPGTTSRTGTILFMIQNTSATALPNSTPELWSLSESGTCSRFVPAQSVDYGPSTLWVPMREIGRARDFSGPLTIR